jgi:hypothetical protein
VSHLHLAQVTGAKLLANRDRPWTPDTMAKRRSLSKSPLDKLDKLNSVSTMDGRPSAEAGPVAPLVGDMAAVAVAFSSASTDVMAAMASPLPLPMMLSMLNVVLLEPLFRPVGTEEEPGELGVVGLPGVPDDSGENWGTAGPLLETCRPMEGDR